MFMLNKTSTKIAVAIALVATLTACGKNNQHARSSTYGDSGIGDMAAFYGENITTDQERALLNTKTLYFGFDKYTVSKQDEMAIYAHAKKLLNNPKLHLRIDGHTDERGSREYNIGLGEKRGNAVANLLAMKGVPHSQYTVVSYGKEKPAAMGHEESSWQLNRRSELTYEN